MRFEAAKKAALLAASRALLFAAASCHALATVEERRRREARRAEAERIVADGEALLTEYLNGRAWLEYAEQEIIVHGDPVPRRLRWELDLWSKLRGEGDAAVGNADPEGARRAVESVVGMARLASLGPR
jgi:hypothetical protein